MKQTTGATAGANAFTVTMAGRLFRAILVLCCMAGHTAAVSRTPDIESDPHRNAAGFFDIHVCNWSDRPLFFMALFSTLRFEEIDSVEILDPDNQHIGYLDTGQYRLVKTGSGREKRVFISQFDVPVQAQDGWYQGVVTLKDGSRHDARDFVIVHRMDRATPLQPPDQADNIPLPETVSWQAVAGAKFYQVFIRDEWQGKLIYESELVSEPQLRLPAGTLENGGSYSWRVHARDVNENVLLGDFNHGSLSRRATFSVGDN